MERKQQKMKRVNIILETDLYDKARIVAFIKRKSVSEIVRRALSEWLARHADARTELLLAEKDERRLLHILESEEFVPSKEAKKSFDL
jgi:Arc/MetJ-type ribon-helix-helix transcriptional regulator